MAIAFLDEKTFSYSGSHVYYSPTLSQNGPINALTQTSRVELEKVTQLELYVVPKLASYSAKTQSNSFFSFFAFLSFHRTRAF